MPTLKQAIVPLASAGALGAALDFAKSPPGWSRGWFMDWYMTSEGDLYAWLGVAFDLPFTATAIAAVAVGLAIEWLYRWHRQRPRLYFGVPRVMPEPLYKLGTNELAEVVYMASVPLHNAPKWRTPDAAVMRAFPAVKFTDLKTGQVIADKNGRWAANPAIGHKDTPANVADLTQRDIHANGVPNLINIVAKRPASEFCYVMTEEGFLPVERGSRLLRSHEMLAEITIQSSSCRDFRGRFVIRCGKDSLSIEPAPARWRAYFGRIWHPLEAKV